MSGARGQRVLSRRRVVQGAGALGLGLLAGCGRWPGQGPAPAKVPQIGCLFGGSPDSGTLAYRNAFLDGLRALGYVDGENIVIEVRLAEGQTDQFDALAAELVNLPVDILVVSGSRATQAAVQATTTIPIVIAQTGDPVDRGFVASLARPGANVTGLSAISPQLSGKRLELLAAVVPGDSPIAVLWDAGSAGVSVRLAQIRAAAQTLGVPVQSVEVREPSDLARAFDAAERATAGGMIVLNNGFTFAHRAQIVELAAQRRLPALYEQSAYPKLGGLMAYGADFPAMYRRAAYYVDRILKGAKPADLPIEQPMYFDFVINAKTAQALGLTIPPHVLLQATEVIQ
jgi:putative tryptophan/tyrosine transport system substrate-binding protein